MKTLIIFFAIIMPVRLMSQVNDYLDYFPTIDSTFAIDGAYSVKELPDKYVLNYIVKGDTSKLNHVYYGINADTREIVYKTTEKYTYWAYGKKRIGSLFVLFNTEYADCEDQYYTTFVTASICKNGEFYDKIYFYVDNVDGVLSRIGQLSSDNVLVINVQHKEKSNGRTMYFMVNEHYVVNEETAKFELISRDTIR